MARYVSWLANAALLALCAVFFSSAANAVFAALLTPDVAPAPREAQQAALPTERTWQDRQVILARNLFNASLLAPAQPSAALVQENLEATKLPLALLGTFASKDPEIARAAVEDQESRTHLVVKVDDEIKGGRAKVIRIERQRLVLSENGTLRELTFEDSLGLDRPSSRASSRVARRPTRRAVPSRRRSSARSRTPSVTPEGLDDAIRNPADLFSQARILPKWEDGQMVGVQVSAIKPGSLFEELGIADGEVITQLNGIEINSPEASAEVMLELSEAKELNVTVLGEDGEKTLQLSTGN